MRWRISRRKLQVAAEHPVNERIVVRETQFYLEPDDVDDASQLELEEGDTIDAQPEWYTVLREERAIE